MFPAQMACCFRNAAVLTTNISGALLPSASSENPIKVFETPSQSDIAVHASTTTYAPYASINADATNIKMLLFVLQCVS